jgi:hypothetical protein
MDNERFDAWTKLIGAKSSRRKGLAIVAAGIVALRGGAAGRSALAGAIGQFGDACTADNQCDTNASLTCDDSRSTCRGDTGFACFDSGDCSSADGFLCLDSNGVECTSEETECGTCGTASTCVDAGEACDDSSNCCAGLVCSSIDDSGNAVCHVACGNEGAECGSDDGCCSGLVCGSSNTCEATAPSGHATVTIHKATCPDGVGPDIFAECHGNVLGGVSFSIDGFEIGSGVITTDSSGVASQTILEAAATGDITITEDSATLASYLGAYVYCAEQNSGTVLVDGHADGGAVTFTANQGDDIICDWYNITEATSQPASTANTDTTPVTLPATGVAGGTDDNHTLVIGAAALTGAAALFAARKLRTE